MFVALDEVNLNAMVALLVIEPVVTVVYVMVIVGGTLSKVQLNCVAAILLFPAESVNLFAATPIVHAP